MRNVPRVQQYMTPSPITIGRNQPMSVAHRLMREHEIRHLPVLEAGRVLGIVSAGDLHLVETLRDVDPNRVTVEEAMTENPYTVPPSEPLDRVVTEMAEHKYGCALVVDHHKVVGIFTTVDACKAFADHLDGRNPT
ncbi:MAG TPA: CBS domain-containing protein [Polyangiaceae bacterium]|nr:CBS domain-containing protein [Polyangiaceae bacterium]